MRGAIAIAVSLAIRPERYAALGVWSIICLTSSAITLALWFVRHGYWLHEPNLAIANAEFAVSAVLTAVVLTGGLLWSRRYGRA